MISLFPSFLGQNNVNGHTNILYCDIWVQGMSYEYIIHSFLLVYKGHSD